MKRRQDKATDKPIEAEPRRTRRRKLVIPLLAFAALLDGSNVEITVGTPTFGIIGGIAGEKFVKDLISLGHKVVVWFENLEDNNKSVLEGVEIAATPKALLDKVDITISFVTDPLAAVKMVSEIFLSDVLYNGKGFVQMGCLNADASQDIANTIERQNGRYLEIQILESDIPSRTGPVGLAAGEQSLYDDCQGFFCTLVHKTFFVGAAGDAMKVYLVLQSISAITQAALVESMSFAESVGIAKTDVQKLMERSNWYSPLLLARAKDMISADAAKTNPLFAMQKDLNMVLELAETQGQPMPLTAAVKEAYKNMEHK